MNFVLTAKGNRKFVIAVMAEVGVHIAAGLGWIDGSQYVWTQGLIFGLFGGANVLEHFSQSN